MEEKKKDKIIDVAAEIGGSTASALIGASVGIVVAGPIGTVGGAILGTAAERAITWIGNEIKERTLSKSESKKIGTAYTYAYAKTNAKLLAGATLRDDGFFDEAIDGCTPAEEIIEGMIFAAQRENEEKKLPYIATLYANICFDETITREMANQLVKLSSDMTFRQLSILAVIGQYQTGRTTNPPLITTAFSAVNGANNISIASEIFDLYRKSLLFSSNAILDAAGFTPALLKVEGMGALLYNLMELSSMPHNEVMDTIIAFLSGTAPENLTGKVVAGAIPTATDKEVRNVLNALLGEETNSGDVKATAVFG